MLVSGGSSGGPSPLSTVRASTPAPIGTAAVFDCVTIPRQFAALEPIGSPSLVVPTFLCALRQTTVPLNETGPIGVAGNAVEKVPETPSWPFGAVVASAAMFALSVPSGVGSGTGAAPQM